MKFLQSIGTCLKENPLYCASQMIICFAILCVIAFVYVHVYPRDTIVPAKKDMEVVTKEVCPGDPFEYIFEFQSTGQYDTIVHRRMINGFVYTLPAVETTSPKEGNYQSTVAGIVVPDETPPGQYYIQIELLVKANFLRVDIINFETESFTVLEPEYCE